MNQAIKTHFDEYPDDVRARLDELRSLIFELSSDLELVEESLK